MKKYNTILSDQDLVLLQCITGLVIFREYKNDFIYTIGNVPIGRMQICWNVYNTYYHYLN